MSRSVWIIINRAARNGAQSGLLERIQQELADLAPVVVVPESYEELVARSRQAADEGIDTVVVVGGDGTVNAVLNQLANSQTALAVIPVGTANDLATHLRIPLDVAGACAVVRRGQSRVLDLIEINGRYFITAGGVGVVSDTAVGVNRLKASGNFAAKAVRTLGSLVYVLYSFGLLIGGKKIVSTLELTLDGKAYGEIPSVALFVNNQPTIGKTVMPFPGARSDDGELGVCVMRQRSRIGSILSVILMSLRGSHTGRRDITMLAGRTLQIKSPTRKLFIGDGEELANTRKLTLNVVPQAIKVLV